MHAWGQGQQCSYIPLHLVFWDRMSHHLTYSYSESCGDSPASAFPTPQTCTTRPSFYVSARDPSSGLCVSVAIILIVQNNGFLSNIFIPICNILQSCQHTHLYTLPSPVSQSLSLPPFFFPNCLSLLHSWEAGYLTLWTRSPTKSCKIFTENHVPGNIS